MKTGNNNHFDPPLWVVNITTLAVAITSITGLVFLNGQISIHARANAALANVENITPEDLSVNPYSAVNLTAKAAVVYDVSTGRVLFDKNMDAQLPLASLTKLMTVTVALENAPSYISVTVPRGMGESDKGILSGERWELGDLIHYALVASSNAAAQTIASVVEAAITGNGTATATPVSTPNFVSLMNDKAKALGLSETYFLNPTGLDENNGVSGGYGSPRDVAALFQYLLTNHRADIDDTTGVEVEYTSLSNRTITAKNTDKVVEEIPGLIGSKTGFTDLAGGNLAVAFDESFGHPVVVVVMNSTEDDRFSDVKALVEATIDFFGQRADSVKK